MVFLFESGAYTVMCKHIQLKKNTWYYRRRIPEASRYHHGAVRTKQEQTQLFFSLKTSDKAEACRRADAHTRNLDALWRADETTEASHLVSLAKLQAAGLKPGDALAHADHPAIDDFIDQLLGKYEKEDLPLKVSAQNLMTIGLLQGDPVPKTLSDARD